MPEKPYFQQYLDAMRQGGAPNRPQQGGQARPAAEQAALPLLADPGSFMNPREAPKPPLSAQGREALRSAPPSNSAGSAAGSTPVPNYSRKLAPRAKPPAQ